MKPLKRNEEFVVFEGNSPSLLCYVDAVLKNDEVRCMVINGGWPFIMDQNTGHAAWQSPSGADQAVFVWVSTSRIPGVPKGDYNTVMNYIRESGYRVGQRTPLRLLVTSGWIWVRSFTHKFKEAVGAFCAVLAGTGVVRPIDSDDQRDDDIPF